jgi:transketolase
VPITQPIAPQAVTVTGTGAAVPVKAKPGIVIKQIVKQEVGTRKARKKRVSKSNKQSLKHRKAEYSTLKKSLRKRLMAQKKSAYSAQAARIKALPAKERTAARKALKQQLKKAHDEKLKQLPALGKRKYNDIVALINKLKKLKW